MRANASPFLLAIALLLPASALAVPPTLGYSGRLFDADGAPATGSVELTFRIFDAPRGGDALFEQSFAGADAVALDDGHFFVQLANNEGGGEQLDALVADYDELYRRHLPPGAGGHGHQRRHAVRRR